MTVQRDAVPKFDSFIPLRIASLSSALSAQATEIVSAGSVLSLGQWRVLMVVGMGWADTSRDVVALYGADPGFVSRVLKSLVKDGYLSVSRSFEDRRVQHIQVLAKGRETLNTILPVMGIRSDFLSGVFDEEERKMFFHLLDKLDDAARKRGFGRELERHPSKDAV